LEFSPVEVLLNYVKTPNKTYIKTVGHLKKTKCAHCRFRYSHSIGKIAQWYFDQPRMIGHKWN